jgi:hypothetical protein
MQRCEGLETAALTRVKEAEESLKVSVEAKNHALLELTTLQQQLSSARANFKQEAAVAQETSATAAEAAAEASAMASAHKREAKLALGVAQEAKDTALQVGRRIVNGSGGQRCWGWSRGGQSGVGKERGMYVIQRCD